MKRAWLSLSLVFPLLFAGPLVSSADILTNNWSALASDRPAAGIGDSVTVLIYETPAASSDDRDGSTMHMAAGGSLTGSNGFNYQGQLGLQGDYNGAQQTSRSGRIVAQISVTVDHVLPNGDLHLAGEQLLNIDGQRTRIRLQGRVRPQDIADNNTVLSTRLADASIDYVEGGRARHGRSTLANFVHWLVTPCCGH